MKNLTRIMTIIGLLSISQLAFSQAITDTYSTGDTLTADKLNTIKDAVNANNQAISNIPAGPKGDKGDTGATGSAGPQGPAGNSNDARVTALEAADDDFNIRVGILESAPLVRQKIGFAVPDNNLDQSNGHPLGTIYIQLGTNNVFISTSDAIAAANWEQVTPKRYAIGDIGPAGGRVFYVTDDGLLGLEAAPVDQADPLVSGAEWGCVNFLIVGADGERIGRGARNTGDILGGCATTGIAADLADAYVLNGYTDWYLPSKDELNLMYSNIGPGNTTTGNVGGFASSFYWSSSEISDVLARVEFFGNGFQGDDLKSSTHGVRAVRAF